MLRVIWLVVALAAIEAGAATPATAQVCRTAADTSARLVNGLKVAYSTIDSATVTGRGEPFANPASISLVVDSLTCVAAVTAYNQTAGASLTSVYVIRLGTSGFAVVNPSDTAGEYVFFYLFNPNWQFKVAVGG